jgi:chromosomal replication initiation ATPase DnaA
MFHRDHTSIIHACQTIDEVLSLKFENDYKDEIERLLKII